MRDAMRRGWGRCVFVCTRASEPGSAAPVPTAQREETGPAVGVVGGGGKRGLPRTARLGLPSWLTYLGRLQAVTWGTLKNKTQMQCQSPNKQRTSFS